MKSKITLFIIIILFSVCNTNGQNPKVFSKHDADLLLKNYVKTIKSGTEKQVKNFWSPTFTNDDFFREIPLYIDKNFPVQKYQEYVVKTGGFYKFNSIKKEKNYFILNAEWIQTEFKNGGKKALMNFYIVFEKGKWFLADPCQVITKDWKFHETEFIIFKYPKRINISNYSSEIEFMTNECRKLLILFNLKLKDKIKYYYVPSAELTGVLITSSPAGGYCVRSKNPEKDPWFNLIISNSFANAHELVHAITALKGIPDINDFFLEGIAVALEGTTWLTSDYSFIETINYIKKNTFMDIRELFSFEGFFKHSTIAYHESGAFVRYLLDRYGFKKYLDFCKAYQTGADISKLCQQHFGYDLDNVISNWKTYMLGKTDSYKINYAIPASAKRFFFMKDGIGDDHGTGTYQYPKHKDFKKGICDIRELEIFKDKKRVYFKIKMQNIIKPVYNPKTRENITAAVYLCINTGNRREIPKNYYSGVKFKKNEGYNFLISAGFGVSVTDNTRKKIIISEKSIEKMMDLKNKTITFSIPVNLIEEPSDNWKITLISGLQTDYGDNITYGNPMDIGKKVSLFVSGGGSDSSVNPRFFDILLPSDLNQESILGSFSVKDKKTAVIPMVEILRQN